MSYQEKDILIKKNKKVLLRKDAFETLAEKIFMDISGLNQIKERDVKKYEMMLEDAMDVKNMIKDRINGRHIYRYFEDFSLEGNCLSVENVTITCTAFDQVRPSMVEGVYIYVLSVGDCSLPEEDYLEQLYADFWGTAYTDAMRILMRKEFEKEGTLGDSFGPGFYGMAVQEMGQFEKLLDFSCAGVKVKDSSMLVPEKSCVGLFFKVNDTYEPLGAACETCRGNDMSCRLCRQMERN